MELLINSSFLCLGLVFFIIYLNKSNRYLDFTVFLYLGLGLTLFIRGFENQEKGTQLISFLILFMALHFVVNYFIGNKLARIFAVLSSLGFLFFYKQSIDFQEYPLIFDFKNMLILPLLAAVFPFIVEWKAKFISRLFPELELESGIYHIATAILVLIALFFGSTFGLALTGITLYGMELYLNRNKEHKNFHSVLVFTLALLGFVIEESGLELAKALQSNVLFGLLIGAGTGILFSKAYLMAHNKYVLKTLLLILGLALVSLVVFLELFKEHLGGVSGFAGLIIGFLLVSKARNALLNLSFLAFSFGILLLALPKLQPQQEAVVKNSKFEKFEEKITEEQETEESLEEVPVVKAGEEEKKEDEIYGNWKINSKGSKIDFELGPEDSRTKGVFSTIKGNFTLLEQTAGSSVKVSIPTKSLSTFNEYRDESLMGEGFLEADKFPVISFKSAKWTKKDAKNYTIEGDFVMKDIKQKLKIDLKILEKGKDAKGEYLLVVAKSSLDRTVHAMESDPKIGDLIDFSGQLELRR